MNNKVVLHLKADEFEALRNAAQRLIRDVTNQAHWYVREGLGMNPPRKLDLPDVVGAVTTRRRCVVTLVETRLYCNRCKAEMRTFSFEPDGFVYKCPQCGLDETLDIRYPAYRELTTIEIAKLKEA